MLRSFLVVAAASIALASAQDPPTRAGRLGYISGSVSFNPAGVDDWAPASVNRPLTTGDQLYTDTGARAEVAIPGAVFRLNSQTAFQFLNLDDRSTQVRLSEGTLNVHVRRMHGAIEIDTPNAAFSISRPGVYRLDANPDTPQTDIIVRVGSGEVTDSAETFPVNASQDAVIYGQNPPQDQVYSVPPPDDFDHWYMSRDRRLDHVEAARWVSPDVVGYEDLDQYGSWRSVPEYGEMWCPRGVASDWAPYHRGHWAWVDPWGYSWVDDEPWGFAPFHYGRWAYVQNTWGWVPGPASVEPVYSPALVAWMNFGHGTGLSLSLGGGPSVGWLPLGPRDVYIPPYEASRTYVNQVNVTNTRVINTTYVTRIYNTYQQTKVIPMASYTNRTVPGAVVAVPHTALASARPVQQVAVRIPPRQLAAVHAAEPAPRVVPQPAAVLGHAPAARAPHPPATVLTRPVVAKSAPPPPPAPFQQRQAVLAKHPGRPIPLQVQRQIAHVSPPPVRVVAQARPVQPHISHAPPPRPGAPPPNIAQHAAPANAAHPGPQPPATAQHPAAPPSQQARGPQPMPKNARPYQPPSAQAHAAPGGRPPAPPPQQARAPRPPVTAQHPAPAPQQARGPQPRAIPPNARPHQPATAARVAPHPAAAPPRAPARPVQARVQAPPPAPAHQPPAPRYARIEPQQRPQYQPPRRPATPAARPPAPAPQHHVAQAAPPPRPAAPPPRAVARPAAPAPRPAAPASAPHPVTRPAPAPPRPAPPTRPPAKKEEQR